jgi:hypothetical protein
MKWMGNSLKIEKITTMLHLSYKNCQGILMIDERLIEQLEREDSNKKWPISLYQGELRQKRRNRRSLLQQSEIQKNLRVEDRGLEPLTFWIPSRRSPN